MLLGSSHAEAYFVSLGDDTSRGDRGTIEHTFILASLTVFCFIYILARQLYPSYTSMLALECDV